MPLTGQSGSPLGYSLDLNPLLLRSSGPARHGVVQSLNRKTSAPAPILGPSAPASEQHGSIQTISAQRFRMKLDQNGSKESVVGDEPTAHWCPSDQHLHHRRDLRLAI